MQTSSIRVWAIGLAVLLGISQLATAAKMSFIYRDPFGKSTPIGSVEELDRVMKNDDGTIRDPDAYSIIKNYLEDVQEIKDKISNSYTNDISVYVNSSTNGCLPGTKSGSWSDGTTVQIQSRDRNRDVSILAHETGHSYMKERFGGFPPFNYGADNAHYANEITTLGTAFTEGYAEWNGDIWGKGQEPAGCMGAGGMEWLKWNSGTNTSYDWCAQTNIIDSYHFFSCEGAVAIMMRDMSKRLPNGTGKVQEMIRRGNTGSTMETFIKDWCTQYPEDAEKIAQIVDVDTNFTMSDADLKTMTGANDYVDKQRAGNKIKYKNKNSCDSLKDIFAPPATGTGLPSPDSGGDTSTKPGVGLDPLR